MSICNPVGYDRPERLTSFHDTFSLLNRLEIRDRIAFWSNSHTKRILLSLSHKKLYVLGF